MDKTIVHLFAGNLQNDEKTKSISISTSISALRHNSQLVEFSFLSLSFVLFYLS